MEKPVLIHLSKKIWKRHTLYPGFSYIRHRHPWCFLKRCNKQKREKEVRTSSHWYNTNNNQCISHVFKKSTTWKIDNLVAGRLFDRSTTGHVGCTGLQTITSKVKSTIVSRKGRNFYLLHKQYMYIHVYFLYTEHAEMGGIRVLTIY